MNEKIKTLQLIHLAICVGSGIAYIFIGELSFSNLKIPTIDATSAVHFSIPILAYIVSNLLFKSQLKQAVKSADEDNFAIYQSACIVRWSVLEAGAFIILFVAPEFVIFGVVLLLYLAALRPTQVRIENDLNNAVR